MSAATEEAGARRQTEKRSRGGGGAEKEDQGGGERSWKSAKETVGVGTGKDACEWGEGGGDEG